jgi:hypothetical protein
MNYRILTRNDANFDSLSDSTHQQRLTSHWNLSFPIAEKYIRKFEFAIKPSNVFAG